jgi:hypothetical protein
MIGRPLRKELNDIRYRPGDWGKVNWSVAYFFDGDQGDLATNLGVARFGPRHIFCAAFRVTPSAEEDGLKHAPEEAEP